MTDILDRAKKALKPFTGHGQYDCDLKGERSAEIERVCRMLVTEVEILRIQLEQARSYRPPQR